jgi:hypothetical protein
MASDLQIIRTYRNDLEAALGQAVLEANGISSVLVSDNAAGALPWLNTLHPIRLAVPTADAELADQLLDGVAAEDDDAADPSDD